MAFEFKVKHIECDFQNKTSLKISSNNLLEVSDEDLASSHKYMQISFCENHFQDNGGIHLFSPCVLGNNTYNTGFFCGQETYNASQLYRSYITGPNFIAFDSDDSAYTNSFTGSQWSVAGWVNPETDYNAWVTNLTATYTAGGDAPEDVNLYVIKIINLKMADGFSTSARYIPLMYKGNDPAIS